MRRDFGRTRRSVGSVSVLSLGRFILAAAVYVGLAIYLYRPHFEDFRRWEYLLALNPCLAALGAYVLSRRWVSAFVGSLFAGVIYGFGPFALALANFHPTIGLLAASIPWLFCPAAFGARTKWRRVTWLSVALPFLAILLYFQVSVHYRLFPASTQARLRPGDLPSLLAPLVVVEEHSDATLTGFYHVPIAALFMGLAMLVMARRISIMAIFVLGIVLACSKSYLNVSPLIWLAIPMLCCSVLIGVGAQGLASAGFADRKWVLLAAAIMAILAIVALFLATKYFQTFLGLGSKYARLLTEAAKMYILGAVAVSVILVMEHAKLRAGPLRWAILFAAMAIDIYRSAGFIVDRILC
jgi:hypothetical protein